jgi:transcriptional regulator with XRE-family HTH domain
MPLPADDLPGKKIGHVRAHLHDLPHELVPHHHRHRNGPLRPRVPLPDVQIRAANAGLMHPDQHVVDANLGHGDIREPQPGTGFLFDQRFHGVVRYIERTSGIVEINFLYARTISGITSSLVLCSPSPSPNRPAPAESADAIHRHLGGRVRQLRLERGWSLEALARASGVSRSMLSEIEREQANPTLAVTLRIARAFGMNWATCSSCRAPPPPSRSSARDDRAYHYRSDAHCQIRTLSPLNLEKDVEFYEVQLKPGGALRSAAHFAGTREFLTVQKGHVRVESADDAETLGPGDSASYRADVPHAIVNTGKGDAVLFLVDIYRYDWRWNGHGRRQRKPFAALRRHGAVPARLHQVRVYQRLSLLIRAPLKDAPIATPRP